ncbi:MAG TPA: aminoglycoside phosphotransferase family protein [Glycomyces sp.]|nr:aminoglycoside phosphotransferase family protein [Glycomyces sp.]
MEITCRPRLSRADVECLVRERLGGDLEFTAHEEFTDGFFNAAHALHLADGRRLVVKVAPAADAEVLTYEAELMVTEIECFERALEAGVPMPKVWHADPEAGILIMDRLKGVPLPKVEKDRLPEAALLGLRREIGAASARFSTMTGERFGYVRKDGRTASGSWAASYLAFIADILRDADRLGVLLPRPTAEIAAFLEGERPLLDAVSRPALVHFDLWDGNIFVVHDKDGLRLDGFIDGERAFYGDPIAELASLTMFVPSAEAEATIHGFLGRAMEPGEERRLVLYRVYLWLILATEGAVRSPGTSETAEQHQWACENLEKEFALLEA